MDCGEPASAAVVDKAESTEGSGVEPIADATTAVADQDRDDAHGERSGGVPGTARMLVPTCVAV